MLRCFSCALLSRRMACQASPSRPESPPPGARDPFVWAVGLWREAAAQGLASAHFELAKAFAFGSPSPLPTEAQLQTRQMQPQPSPLRGVSPASSVPGSPLRFGGSGGEAVSPMTPLAPLAEGSAATVAPLFGGALSPYAQSPSPLQSLQPLTTPLLLPAAASVPRDEAAAVGHLRASAELGCGGAMFLLAAAHHFGALGLASDPLEARKWCVANQGRRDALHRLHLPCHAVLPCDCKETVTCRRRRSPRGEM